MTDKQKTIQIKSSLTFGCDPELFFKQNNRVIGSEKVLPKDGIESNSTTMTSQGEQKSKITLDGVQLEFNPRANTCRANLGNDLRYMFTALNKFMKENKKDDVKIDFTEVVKVDPEEMESLSERSRSFGCMPSYNIYLKENEGISPITVNPAKYLYRSAGGHIHLGTKPQDKYDSVNKDIMKAVKDYNTIVPVIDIIVGNTCVLLDRHPLAKERRKVYGRAGEYRKPKYGVEYRTLSNFWMKDYRLVSLVMGLSRIAVNVVANSYKDRDYAKELMSKVDIKDIIKAINNNDYELAKKNFDKIKGYLCDIINPYDDLPFNKSNIAQFEHFLNRGLGYWFEYDNDAILKHWLTLGEGHGIGWESFLAGKITEDYNKVHKSKREVKKK